MEFPVQTEELRSVLDDLSDEQLQVLIDEAVRTIGIRSAKAGKR